ncbi:hypothetical protein HYH02_006391 [Chlamydomonas schloesseri]|uniref:EF-hand domain-containing protein n=1 Tax=Chlamydomonas schloesseri TaxID=2026947 RepID=A0A835WKH9_9CHLO|nr:hypothetical protein HYH02_006391 [Chlamydomonas schloesseri]|eukprot:KAG2448500.1 hypothetical protein HYH02_006391 [Chlamydomonas schloesseri]
MAANAARVLFGLCIWLVLGSVCAQTGISPTNGTKTNSTTTTSGTTTVTQQSTSTTSSTSTTTSGATVNGPTTGVPGNNTVYDCKTASPPLVNLGNLTRGFTVVNTEFRNCNGGTAIIIASEVSSGVNVTFNNCRFYNLINLVVPPDTNFENVMGGALRVLGSVELRLVNCSFYNNQAVRAAAIYARAGNPGPSGFLVLDGTTFSNNRGQGTVMIDDGAVGSWSGVVFRENFGGSALHIRSMRTTGNSAAGIINTSFINNTATDGTTFGSESDLGRCGAGMYIESTSYSLTFANLNFTSNTALKCGGAIALTNVDEILLTNSTFSSNRANVTGGAIWAESATLITQISTFTSNSAQQGGAITAGISTVLRTPNSVFRDNSADRFGGAISAFSGASLYMDSSRFVRNSATYAGAVECWSCPKVVVNSCTFQSNTARQSAGALSLYGATSALTLSGNTFVNNTAATRAAVTTKHCFRDGNGQGGALCVSLQANVDLVNNTFVSNLATSGGAIYASRQCEVLVDDDTCQSASVRLYGSNDFATNRAVGGGGGAVYAVEIAGLSLACPGSTAANLTDGDEIPDVYTSSGCSGWSGNNTADAGGYGGAVATGMAGLRTADRTNTTALQKFTSDDLLPVMFEMYDAFGSSIRRGSYDANGTTVTVTVNNSSDLLSGSSSNITAQGLATFSTLRLRAAPGPYNLTATGLPSGGDISDYEPALVVVTVRACSLGEVIDNGGITCRVCKGTLYYSFRPANAECDVCPSNAYCLNGVDTTTNSSSISTTDLSSSGSGGSGSGRRRRQLLSSTDQQYVGKGNGYLVPKEGYWHSSPFSPQMSKCPTSSACDYTGRAAAIGAFQTVNLSSRDTNTPTPSDSPIANISYYWSLQCSEGYTGTLCAQCDTPGYGLRSSGQCTKCPAQGLNTLYYCLSYLLTIVLLVWTIRSTLTRSLGEARAAHKAVLRRTRSLRRQTSADAEDLHHDVGGGDDGEGEAEGEGGEEGLEPGEGRTGARPVAEGGSCSRGARGGSGTASGHNSRREGQGVLERAAVEAAAQLESGAERNRNGYGEADSEGEGEGTGRAAVNGGEREGEVRGVPKREGSVAGILPPAALPGRSRVPRSVRARESRLGAGGAAGAAAAGVAPGAAAAAADGGVLSDDPTSGSDGDSRGVQSRHRLSRMSRGEGAAGPSGKSIGAVSAAPPFGGPIAESAEAGGDGGEPRSSGTGGLWGLRKRVSRNGRGGGGGWRRVDTDAEVVSSADWADRRPHADVDDDDDEEEEDWELDDGKRRAGSSSRGANGAGKGHAAAPGGGHDAGADGGAAGAEGKGGHQHGGGGLGDMVGAGAGKMRWAAAALRRRQRRFKARLKADEMHREEKPPHTIVLKILVNYLQVTTVARDLDLEYPALVERIFNIGSQASSAVSTFVSLDCSLPDNGLSKAIQRTLINVCLPGIFVLLSVPVWMLLFLFAARGGRKTAAADDSGPAGPPAESKDGPLLTNHHSHQHKDADANADAPADDLAAAKEAAKAESAKLAPSSSSASAPAAAKPPLSDKDGRGDGLHGGQVLFRPYFATRMAVTLIAVIFYFYPSVTDEILSVLQCKEVDSSSGAYAEYSRALGMYWEQDYGLHCFRGSHLLLALVVAFPGVVLFCLGVPMASAAFLRRNALRGRLNERKFSDRYGFLYEDYRRSYYYWESVIMLRKLCAVGLLILTSSQDDIIQVLSVLGVVVVALTAQVMCKPYVYERFNKLERTSLVATSLILYLCCFFLVSNLSDTAREVLSVIIAVINVGMLVWFGYCLAVEAWRYAVRVLDSDGDGKVTKGEVRQFLAQTLGAPLAKLISWLVHPAAKKPAKAQHVKRNGAASAAGTGAGAGAGAGRVTAAAAGGGGSAPASPVRQPAPPPPPPPYGGGGFRSSGAPVSESLVAAFGNEDGIDSGPAGSRRSLAVAVAAALPPRGSAPVVPVPPARHHSGANGASSHVSADGRGGGTGAAALAGSFVALPPPGALPGSPLASAGSGSSNEGLQRAQLSGSGHSNGSTVDGVPGPRSGASLG